MDIEDDGEMTMIDDGMGPFDDTLECPDHGPYSYSGCCTV